MEKEKKKPKIVLINCSQRDAEHCKANLEKFGFDIISTIGGKDGYEAVKRHKPDAVVSEIVMRDGDGFYVADKIKNDDQVSKIPLITFTDLESKEDEEEFRKLGVAEHIVRTKCTPEKAAKKIKEVLEKNRDKE